MTEYRCVNGHDLCATTYPGPDCPYCERVPVSNSTDAERRQLRTGARQLLLLAERCPALFKHVLAPIPDDVLETLREIAELDDEEDDHAAN